MKFLAPLSSILVAFLMLFATASVSYVPDVVDRVEHIDSPLYQGGLDRIVFEYTSGLESDYEDICYYTDEYFNAPSDVFNQNLATASLCVAMSAFMTQEPSPGHVPYANVRDLMGMMGFSDFRVNDGYLNPPTTESIGVAVAKKSIQSDDGEHTLIAVAIRGGGYGAEWAGNFVIGSGEDSEGHHKGFYDAANLVRDFVEDYASDSRISGDVKVWVTGYSRAAATANMFAGLMDADIAKGVPPITDGIVLERDDLYAYTFCTPMGALKNGSVDPKADDYDNIWNLVNRNDPFTKMAMDAMGFCTFGNDVFVPDSINDPDYESKRDRMLEFYWNLDSRIELMEYTIDDFVPYVLDLGGLTTGEFLKVDSEHLGQTQGQCLDRLMADVTEQIGGREGYVDLIEDDLCGLMGEVFTDFNEMTVSSLLFLIGYGIMNQDVGGEKCYVALFKDLILSNESSMVQHLQPVVHFALEICFDVLYGEGYITDEALDEKAHSYSEKISSLAILLSKELITDVDSINGLVSLAMNFEGVAIAHNHDLTFSWMKTMDGNYSLP